MTRVGDKRKATDALAACKPPRPPPSSEDNSDFTALTNLSGPVDSSEAPNITGDTSTAHKDKKPRSCVWGHFEKKFDTKGVETGRVTCIWCNGNYQGKSGAGTSSLWKHLRESCKKFPHKKDLAEAQKNRDKSQTTLQFHKATEAKNAQLVCFRFNQETCRRSLVKMIIVDELPFRTVEKRGFKEFCAENIPEFRIPSRRTIVRDCYSLFNNEKRKLKASISSQCQRVSFTTDTWTSIQNLNYMCLTAHFIDSQWCMQKKILNFCVIKSHKGVNIANAIDSCMEEWGLSRMMCITVDNASSNDNAIQQLKKKLTRNNALVLGGEAFHMRCCAHILQLVVKDGLQQVDNSIRRIRAVIKYIRSSPERLTMFKNCCLAVDVQYKKALCLDCPTRWNSTYLMLEIALGYEKVFDKLEIKDSQYAKDFENDSPIDSDWLKIKNLCKFLKRFYGVTCKLSGSSYSTSNIYFPEMMKVLKDIETCQNSKSPSLKEMGCQMRAKFDKYWGSVNTINVMLFVAVVLDPRYKMKYLKAKYTAFYSDNDANELVEKVTRILNELIDEYKFSNEPANSNFGAQSSNQCHGSGEGADDEIDDDIDDYFLQVDNENVSAEDDLEKYLNELAEPYVVDFDLLAWWKVNSTRYPFLSKVAKDVLAIQCSTVASESTFSTSGRTLDQFRSSLTPHTAEVLICCQDWLRIPGSTIQSEEELEELEALEIDIANDPEVAAGVSSVSHLDG